VNNLCKNIAETGSPTAPAQHVAGFPSQPAIKGIRSRLPVLMLDDMEEPTLQINRQAISGRPTSEIIEIGKNRADKHSVWR
jgi:hypothetical protein